MENTVGVMSVDGRGALISCANHPFPPQLLLLYTSPMGWGGVGRGLLLDAALLVEPSFRLLLHDSAFLFLRLILLLRLPGRSDLSSRPLGVNAEVEQLLDLHWIRAAGLL